MKERNETGNYPIVRFDAFEEAYKALTDKLRPMVVELGFLKGEKGEGNDTAIPNTLSQSDVTRTLPKRRTPIDKYGNPFHKVIVDYQPPYSSFGVQYYNAHLHLEYDPISHDLKYRGWELSEEQRKEFSEFLLDSRNLKLFFSDSIASNEGGWTTSSPGELTIQWGNLIKTIKTGPLAEETFHHPFHRN